MDGRFPPSALEQIVKDDINDALERDGDERRISDVSVSARSLCDCEFCTHPDHQHASYKAYIGVGHKTAIPMRTLHWETFQSYDLRQNWIVGCIARLTREWDRQEAV